MAYTFVSYAMEIILAQLPIEVNRGKACLATNGRMGRKWHWLPVIRTTKKPAQGGLRNRVGGQRWSLAYKVYQASDRTVLCCPASHGIRAGPHLGDLSNRVPLGARPTLPRYPLAHQSASSPTGFRIAKAANRKPDFLDRFHPWATAAGWINAQGTTRYRLPGRQAAMGPGLNQIEGDVDVATGCFGVRAGLVGSIH